MRTVKKNHGLATMMVLIVVALASLIGMAILSSSALQEEIAESSSRAAAADYLTESAIQTAAFYLQNPAKMPATWTHTGYALYARGVTISGAIGSFDVDASTTTQPDVYLVNAVGYSGGSATPSRSSSATIQVVRAHPTSAGEFGGAMSIPAGYTFNGAVHANGNVTSSGSISGSINQSVASTDFQAPTVFTINHYGGNISGGSYTMANGTIGYPQVFSGSTTITSASLPAAVLNNPGNVFYYSGPLTISASGSLQINGTLIIGNSVTVKSASGSAASITVIPQSGFPALIADSQLVLNSTNIVLNIEGITWIGSKILWTGGSSSGSKLVIDGSLVMPSGGVLGAIPVLGSPSAKINFVDISNVTNLTTTAQPITSVKMQTWTQ